MAFTYNINDNATQVLAAKKVKENIFVDLVHKNGYGVNETEEINASSVRFFKTKQSNASARQLGQTKNGAFFNASAAEIPQVIEYDLDLLYVYDQVYDLPEVQQDMVAISVFDTATKNIGGRIATEINASTIAKQLAVKYNAAAASSKSTAAEAWAGNGIILDSTAPDYYGAIQEASTVLDDGDEANGIQAFPFEEREILMRAAFRKNLLSTKGVLIGGSNYAQSMLAKGAVAPEARKEFGNMYCGEIDMIPCYIVPSAIWKRAGAWAGAETAFDATQAVVLAASGTDRGISPQDYIKVIDAPNGAGKRLQPKVRWGINVCYEKAVVPILASSVTKPSAALTILAPGSKA